MQLKNLRNQVYSLVSLLLLLAIIVSATLVVNFLAGVVNKSFTTDDATAQRQIVRFNLSEWEQVKNRLPNMLPKTFTENPVINTPPIVATPPPEQNLNNNVNLATEGVNTNTNANVPLPPSAPPNRNILR